MHSKWYIMGHICCFSFSLWYKLASKWTETEILSQGFLWTSYLGRDEAIIHYITPDDFRAPNPRQGLTWWHYWLFLLTNPATAQKCNFTLKRSNGTIFVAYRENSRMYHNSARGESIAQKDFHVSVKDFYINLYWKISETFITSINQMGSY